jgi:hypothetical protein
MMNLTEELNGMMQTEETYVGSLKAELAGVGESMTDEAEHDLRMGFRTHQMIQIRLLRHREGRDPITGYSRP